MQKKLLSTICLFLTTFCLTGCNVDVSQESPDSTPDTTASFLHGQGVPSENLGCDYAHYYDEVSRFVYEKNSGKWINKYTIGGEGLYKDVLTETVSLKATNENSKTKREQLIQILSNSFYSTNISASYSYVDENDNMPEGTYDLQIKVSQEYSYMYSNDNESISYLCRTRQDGHEIFIDGQYQKLLGEEMIFTMMPFPSFDSITYHNFGIYQENLGQMTAIISANINKAYFDTASGFYKLDKIKIKHGELSNSCYMQEADNLTFSFWFKPSSNNEYVEVAYFNILESNVITFEQKLKINFYDYHQTEIVLPN